MLGLLFASPAPAGESFALRVLSTDKGAIAAVAVRTATLVFDVEEGSAPTKGDVLVCKQDVEVRDFGDHRDHFVILRCGDRRLILRGVFFE